MRLGSHRFLHTDGAVLIGVSRLVATALGLAPCAIGAGNTDRFATVAGTHDYEETSVGEFALSGQPVKDNTL